MDGSGVLVLVLVATAFAVVAYVRWRIEKKRREALAALAAELGWRFEPGRDRSHDREYAQFGIFRQGHGRAATNTLTGDLEIRGRRYRARMGDFKYKVTSGSGKNRSTTTYRFSYLILALPFPDVPTLLIRREGVLDRLAGFLGLGALSFESEEFNRRFHVNGSDRRFAHGLVDPRMMEFLLETDPPTIDMEEGHLCLSDGSSRWSPEEFREWVEWGRSFLDRWPEHLKVELETRADREGGD